MRRSLSTIAAILCLVMAGCLSAAPVRRDLAKAHSRLYSFCDAAWNVQAKSERRARMRADLARFLAEFRERPDEEFRYFHDDTATHTSRDVLMEIKVYAQWDCEALDRALASVQLDA